MDWKIFGTAFVTVFLAELGDKTQFAAMALSAGNNNKLAVLLGVVLALALAGVIGVALGGLLGAWLDPKIMRWVSGGMFLAIGAWILIAG